MRGDGWQYRSGITYRQGLSGGRPGPRPYRTLLSSLYERGAANDQPVRQQAPAASFRRAHTPVMIEVGAPSFSKQDILRRYRGCYVCIYWYRVVQASAKVRTD